MNWHILKDGLIAPPIAVGAPATVEVTVWLPQELVAVIVLEPVETPLTRPPEVTVATPVLLLVHDVAFVDVSAVVPPTHMPLVPVIAPGVGLAVTDVVVAE